MSADSRVQEAIRFLKAKEKANARQIIDTLLTEHPSDANLWYLAAMASEDRQQHVRLLNRVLQLEPGHPKAKQALRHLSDPIAIAPSPEPEPERKYESARPVTGNQASAKPNIRPQTATVILVLLLLLATSYASYQYGRETQKNDILNTVGAMFGGLGTALYTPNAP